MHATKPFTLRALALGALFALVSCASGPGSAPVPQALPTEPRGLGRADSAQPAPGVPAYIETGATNQRGKAALATRETNAGVRVLDGMLRLWAPRPAADGKVYVDADSPAPADGPFAAVAASDWSGVPGQATDGKVLDEAVHRANIGYVEVLTRSRTPEQERAAYLDDRRGKSVSISDALGPLQEFWISGTRQSTTILGVPSDAASVKYDDKGTNRGLSSAQGNLELGKAVDLVLAASGDASTEPAKRYYKYARPYRWSDRVVVAPSLVPVKSPNPATDGGFPSGHTAEAWRDALTVAWLVPQRFQEMVTRAYVMGENRMLAGMHSPLDVVGGRVMATAQVAYNLSKPSTQALAQEAYAQTQGYLNSRTQSPDALALGDWIARHSGAADPYADPAANRARVLRLMAPGLPQSSGSGAPAVVPLGAEVLLATRLPYLSDSQRRVVLKTTAFPGGYPVMDDAEGWGRLNLFAAADGYGRFDGDVEVTMDASRGGFSARDAWRNDISGPGMLTKRGTGTLLLSGDNSYTGGTVVDGGTLVAAGTRSLGRGDLWLSSGLLVARAAGGLDLAGSFTAAGGSVQVVSPGTSRPSLRIAGTAQLAGGRLILEFPGQVPSPGTAVTVLSASRVVGEFAQVTAPGRFTVEYGPQAVRVRFVD